MTTPPGVSEHDISVMIVALRGAAMRYKDNPVGALLAIKTTKDIDTRAVASFAHMCEEIARELERTRRTVFSRAQHEIVVAALRVCATEWPKMATYSAGSKKKMMLQFSTECAALSNYLERAIGEQSPAGRSELAAPAND